MGAVAERRLTQSFGLNRNSQQRPRTRHSAISVATTAWSATTPFVSSSPNGNSPPDHDVECSLIPEPR